tara:strand:- start:2066 stop:2488 length:423 start_codon:yes stop_codon:yes gene_type:complete
MTITKKQIELIKTASRKLQHAIDHRGGTWDYVAELIQEETRQERQHRAGWCAGREYPKNFGPKIAAELFTAQHVIGFAFDYLRYPAIEDVLSLRRTYITAASIAANYREQITDAIPKYVAEEIRALDYGKLCSMYDLGGE